MELLAKWWFDCTCMWLSRLLLLTIYILWNAEAGMQSATTKSWGSWLPVKLLMSSGSWRQAGRTRSGKDQTQAKSRMPYLTLLFIASRIFLRGLASQNVYCGICLALLCRLYYVGFMQSISGIPSWQTRHIQGAQSQQQHSLAPPTPQGMPLQHLLCTDLFKNCLCPN